MCYGCVKDVLWMCSGCVLNLFWMCYERVMNAGWRHQMETFSALLTLCAGNSPVTGEFPTQRPVTRSFDVSFDLHLIKCLSKQSWGWWFETPSCPLWRHRYAAVYSGPVQNQGFWHECNQIIFIICNNTFEKQEELIRNESFPGIWVLCYYVCNTKIPT